jgi:hypothetical protein
VLRLVAVSRVKTVKGVQLMLIWIEAGPNVERDSFIFTRLPKRKLDVDVRPLEEPLVAVQEFEESTLELWIRQGEGGLEVVENALSDLTCDD